MSCAVTVLCASFNDRSRATTSAAAPSVRFVTADDRSITAARNMAAKATTDAGTNSTITQPAEIT
jgi:hypothetical protein